jgi:hypothetical protein
MTQRRQCPALFQPAQPGGIQLVSGLWNERGMNEERSGRRHVTPRRVRAENSPVTR